MKPVFKPKMRLLAATAAIIVMFAAGALMLRIKFSGDQQTTIIYPKKTAEKHSAPVNQPSPGWWESRRLIYFDIPARVYFYLPEGNRQEAKKIAGKAWAEFARIGDIFNPSDPESETSRLNAADKTVPVIVSEDLFAVLKLSKRLWKASGGAFDPTMSPVKKLWRKGAENQHIPTGREIKEVLSRTGFGHVRLLPEKNAIVCDTKGIKFDFGGIAKGFAVDRVRSLLKDAGIGHGLVKLGGEIAAFGSNESRPWHIGIQHPTDMESIWGIISAQGPVRVSTSGNYRQPLIIQGHSFYHIFSPKTGKPVSQKVLGVTTAGFEKNLSSALLDGAATSITVSGTKKGMELSEKLGIESLVLTGQAEGAIKKHITAGLSEHYEPENTFEQ